MADHAGYGESPFTPQFDEAPPYLAGRDAELADWSKRLARMTAKGAGAPRKGNILLIYGPRGMGKTVLLEEFARMAAGRGIDVVEQEPDAFLRGPEALAARLLADAREASHRRQTQEAGGTMGFAGSGAPPREAETHQGPLAETGTLKSRLEAQCRQGPMAILIDEAHAIKGKDGLDALNALVNAAQNLAKKLPFTLALAGTPGLLKTLKDADCSFIERAGKKMSMGVGRLDPEASKEAIRQPLAGRAWRLADGARLTVAEEALDHLVKDSQGYPYFLQLWGDELWDYAIRKGKARLEQEDALLAGPAVMEQRAGFYAQRGQELTGGYLLEAANAVAEAFAAAPSGKRVNLAIAERDIGLALEAEIPDTAPRRATAQQLLAELRHLGFCWERPGEGFLTAGIPSYMDHAQGMYKDFT